MSAWERRFGAECWPRVLHLKPYAFVSAGAEASASGTAVRRQFVLPDADNTPVGLNADVYSNHYRLLALIWVTRREILRKQRIILPADVIARGA